MSKPVTAHRTELSSLAAQNDPVFYIFFLSLIFDRLLSSYWSTYKLDCLDSLKLIRRELKWPPIGSNSWA